VKQLGCLSGVGIGGLGNKKISPLSRLHEDFMKKAQGLNWVFHTDPSPRRGKQPETEKGILGGAIRSPEKSKRIGHGTRAIEDEKP
jgi:hypothetical protein